jgi:hypothetical protein
MIIRPQKHFGEKLRFPSKNKWWDNNKVLKISLLKYCFYCVYRAHCTRVRKALQKPIKNIYWELNFEIIVILMSMRLVLEQKKQLFSLCPACDDVQFDFEASLFVFLIHHCAGDAFKRHRESDLEEYRNDQFKIKFIQFKYQFV